MSVSYILSSENGGYNSDLDTIIGSSSGLVKLSHSGSGTTARAVPSLAISATPTAANDYMAGSTSLAGLADITFVTGDLIVGDVAVPGALKRFAIGTNNQILKSNGTTITWAAPSTTGTVTSVAVTSADTTLTISGSPITTSGTITVDLNIPVPISKGGTGQITKAAAFDALSPTTTAGDMIYYSGGTNTRLPIGTNGQYLNSNGTIPVWGSIGTFPLNSGGAATYGTVSFGASDTVQTISTTAVLTTSLIFITFTGANTTPPNGAINNIVNGTSFDIVISAAAADNAYTWMLVNP